MTDFTKVTPEQIDLAKTATSAEQLQAMAKDAGIELDDQKAASLFARLHGEGELDDDTAGAVTGGDVWGNAGRALSYLKTDYDCKPYNPCH